MQFDYSSLFRDRLYSGFDRIASANQLTTGITACVYDKLAIERFNISIGQIYYFLEHHTGDNSIQWEKVHKANFLIWAGDVYWCITNNYSLHHIFQYDLHLNNILTSSSMVEYTYNEGNRIQLTYRYINPKYIQLISSQYVSTKQYEDNISQIGGAIKCSIDDHWSIVGAYYFDTNTIKSTNQLISLKYNSCCYGISIGYEQKINDRDVYNDNIKYNKVIGFNIELRGLNAGYN